MLTEKKLADIQRRANEALPGPWEEAEGGSIKASDKTGKRSVPLFRAEIPVGYFATKSIEPDIYLRAEEAASRNVRFAAAARKDVPAMLQHIADLQKENDRLRKENDRLKIALVHPDAGQFLDRLSDLESINCRLKEECSRLQDEREQLREVVGAVRAKVHAHTQKISAPIRRELRDVCDAVLQATQPRTWQASHRHYKEGYCRVFIEVHDDETGRQMIVCEALTGRKWTCPKAQLIEILPDGRRVFQPVGQMLT